MHTTTAKSTTSSSKLVYALAALLITGLGLFAALLHQRAERKVAPSVATSFDEEQTTASRAYVVAPRASRELQAGPRLVAAYTPVAEPAFVPPTAEQMRRQTEEDVAREMEKLQRTGAPSGRLSLEVASVFDTWRRTTKLGDRVEFGEQQCFSGGCKVVATYKNLEGFTDVNRNFQESKAFKSWVGPKFRSGPLTTSSGAVQAVWILYNNKL